MTRQEIFKNLNLIFQDVFDDETIHVKESTTAADIEDWDSLTYVTLIITIEKHFHIKFDMKEVSGFANVGEMADAIERKI
ncbi:MAG: acyl carrier protein [Negativicutes bacterium]|nr:acyl carrier protein [Negativicutes bacterium]